MAAFAKGQPVFCSVGDKQKTTRCRHSAQILSIEYVVPNPGSSNSRPSPRHWNIFAVIEQCTVSRILRRVYEEIGRDDARPCPAVSITRPVALAVTPPRKLTRAPLAALIYNSARCRRKMPTSCAIEYGPTDSNHSVVTFSSCFPIHRKREALLLFVQALGTSVVRIQRCQNTNYYRQYYYPSNFHIVLHARDVPQLKVPTCYGNNAVMVVNER